MSRKILFNKRFCYLYFTVFVVAVGVGAFYCAKLSDADFSPVGDYISQFTKQKTPSFPVLKKTLPLYTAFAAAFFVGSFFRPRAFIISAVIFYEGFAVGFCSGSLIRTLGNFGIAAAAACQLDLLFLVPSMCVFGAFCTMKHLYLPCSEKKLKIFLIFIQVLMFTIFCVCAIFRSYVNTTFMNFVFAKIGG